MKTAILLPLLGLILADEKCRRFPAREAHSQLLDEVLQIEGGVVRAFAGPDQCSKGIDHHDAGARRLDFLNDACEEILQRVVDHIEAQIDEADRLVHAGHLEERELLLIAQHLERRLAGDRDI